jgi:hypothetical protein
MYAFVRRTVGFSSEMSTLLTAETPGRLHTSQSQTCTVRGTESRRVVQPALICRTRKRLQFFPPLTTRKRMSPAGRSGGRCGGMSVKRAPQGPRASSRHGQSADKRTRRSSSKISAPNFTASRARRYAPARLQTSQRSRTST